MKKMTHIFCELISLLQHDCILIFLDIFTDFICIGKLEEAAECRGEKALVQSVLVRNLALPLSV